jgi:hypothetical protein
MWQNAELGTTARTSNEGPTQKDPQTAAQALPSTRDKLLSRSVRLTTIIDWILFVFVPVLIMYFTLPRKYAATVSIASLVLAVFFYGDLSSVRFPNDKEKQRIKFDVYDPADVVREMARAGEKLLLKSDKDPTASNLATDDCNQVHQTHLVIQAGLEALSRKYQKLASRKRRLRKNKEKDCSDGYLEEEENVLSRYCLDGAYIAFRTLGESFDDTVNDAVALLTLVAKKVQVRRLHLDQSDMYSLPLGPMACLGKALRRAKQEEQQSNELQHERAEIQRKGCLLLGALADGNVEIAQLIGEHDGISHLLQVIDWYRYHAEVCNWGLWAIINLCYDDANAINQCRLVRDGGIPIVLQTLHNNGDSQVVARHGIGKCCVSWRGSLAICHDVHSPASNLIVRLTLFSLLLLKPPSLPLKLSCSIFSVKKRTQTTASEVMRRFPDSVCSRLEK